MFLYMYIYILPCLILQFPGCVATSALRDWTPSPMPTYQGNLPPVRSPRSQQERRAARDSPWEGLRGRSPERATTAQKKDKWFRDRHGKWLPHYYDVPEEKLKVPCEPWSIGDEPQEGRMHVDIYVGGKKFGHVTVGNVRRKGVPKDIEFAISHDDFGELPIGDPAHEDKQSRNRNWDRRENEKIQGFRVTKMHDGFCERDPILSGSTQNQRREGAPRESAEGRAQGNLRLCL